jgi:putative tricarboxylic transport membrane protein
MRVRAPKDFWSGLMFIGFAGVALVAARDYSLGSAVRMGPGYFPLLLGLVLACIGGLLVVRSVAVDGAPVDRLQVRPLASIVIGVVLFGALLERLGLVVVLVAAVVVSALASRESRPVEVAALATALAFFSVAVFVYGLRLPLPLWPAL